MTQADAPSRIEGRRRLDERRPIARVPFGVDLGQWAASSCLKGQMSGKLATILVWASRDARSVMWTRS